MVFEVESMGRLSSYPTVLMSMTIQRFDLLSAGFTSDWLCMVTGIVCTIREQVLHVFIFISFHCLPSKSFGLVFWTNKRFCKYLMFILTFCYVELNGTVAWWVTAFALVSFTELLVGLFGWRLGIHLTPSHSRIGLVVAGESDLILVGILNLDRLVL